MRFPCGSAGKESACNAGDPVSIPGKIELNEEGKGYPLQYSGLENSTDCIVHGVAKSRTRLSDFHFRFQSPSLMTRYGTCMCLTSVPHSSLSALPAVIPRAWLSAWPVVRIQRMLVNE